MVFAYIYPQLDPRVWAFAHPFLMYHDLLTATVKDSHYRACWLCSKMPGRTEEGMNRWDAVTDGDWGSEAGQQRCASLSPTDIIHPFIEGTRGESKCWGMTRNAMKDCTQSFTLFWKCLKFIHKLKLWLVAMSKRRAYLSQQRSPVNFMQNSPGV